MKQNIIIPIEFNEVHGGMVLSVISLIKGLSENYNVSILACKDAKIFKLGLPAHHLVLQNSWIISKTAPLKTIRTYLEVQKLIKKFDKEETLVLTNNVGSELIFSGFGFFPISIKRIFVSRGGDYKGVTGYFVKRGFKSAKGFIATSKRQLDVLMQNDILIINTHIINNGIKNIDILHDGIPFNKDDNFSYDSNKKNEIIISVIGFISANKNQILAVKALADLLKLDFKVSLHFYGIASCESDKIYEKKLLQEIENFGVKEHVFFKGFVTDQFEIYKGTDILVSTSLSEGFGRTIVEAMSYGIPCIGLKESGGILDIITDNYDGILINNNKEELVNAIRKISGDKKFRKYISNNGIYTYNLKFTEEVMINHYKIFLDKAFNF